MNPKKHKECKFCKPLKNPSKTPASNVKKLGKLTADIIIKVTIAKMMLNRSVMFVVGPAVARLIVNTRICANDTVNHIDVA